MKWLFIGIFGLIAAFSGWQLWSDYQQEKLWGYLPLWFFLSTWLLLVFAITFRWRSNSSKWKYLGLSTAAGVLLGIGFPPFPMPFLLFIGFVPVLLIEDEVKSARKLFIYAYHAFVLWNIIATYWVANTAFIAGIVAIWLNAFFMTIPILLYSRTKRYLPRLAFLSLIVYWLSFELLHLQWEIAWPWLNLGNAWSIFPSLIQWYEYTGTFGGSLWILLLNVLIFQLIKRRLEEKRWSNRLIFRTSLLIVFPLFFSIFSYFTYNETGTPVKVVVVQPNFEPHYEKFSIPDNVQVRKFMKLSDSILTQETQYLVFPETSFGMVQVSEMRKNRELVTLENFLQRYPGLKLVTGVDSYKIFSPDEPATPNTREVDRGTGNVLRYEAYNAAIQLTADTSASIPHYKKSKLVPGPEIFPYRKLLFFFEPVIKKLDGTIGGLGTQPVRSTFNSEYGRIAPVICYESVFGEYVTGYIKSGAEAIFIMTNDGWWDNTAGHKQHLYYASLRAIETRRSIARSANSGISAFINQRGDILQPTDYAEAVAIEGEILFNDTTTFYVKWGDIIARLALFTAVILLLNLIVRGIIKERKSPI